MLPVNWLSFKCKTKSSRDPSDAGMVPVNWLLPNSRNTFPSSDPSDAGMVPVKRLLSKLKTQPAPTLNPPWDGASHALAHEVEGRKGGVAVAERAGVPVSYTHLTLPTIYSV